MTERDEALRQILTVCEDNANAERKDMALRFIHQICERALLRERGGRTDASPAPANGMLRVGQRGGTKDDWLSGDTAWFEYHCQRSHSSKDAELWYRDHQQVLVLGDDDYDKADDLDTLLKRGEAAQPRVYRVKFIDGFEGSVVEDELLQGPIFFDPALGPPPISEILTARAALSETKP